MANYRRARLDGGIYFFTLVTYRRQNILTDPQSRRILRAVIEDVRQRHPFVIDAWVLLPDHLHSVWTLPQGDNDFSRRWGLIKAGFSKRIKRRFHREDWMSSSRRKHREATVWQRRFWEHCMRDEADFRRHIDYVHWNPVKHGLVKNVQDWPHSTLHRHPHPSRPNHAGRHRVEHTDETSNVANPAHS